jgi:hypothetical protein
MPNSVKKHRFPQEPVTVPEADDDFDFGSLDELATMMVDALTLPLPGDFRDADGSDTGAIDPRTPHTSKRIN